MMYFVKNMHNLFIAADADTHGLKNIALNCQKTTSIIRNHKIPHFLINYTDCWMLLIDDAQAAFAILCGLNIEEKHSNNTRILEHINFLFDE